MIVAPGATIGILGGGQLGRMLAIAAAQLGYKCHVYAPDEAPPAAEVAAAFTRGDYDDEAALARFGASVRPDRWPKRPNDSSAGLHHRHHRRRPAWPDDRRRRRPARL